MRKASIILILAALLSVVAVAQGPEPKTAEWHFNEGLRLFRVHSLDEALSNFKRSAELDDRQPTTFANIGTVEFALGQYEKAEAAFRNAIRLAPGDGNYFAELCAALSLQKKHQEAVEACESGVRLSPDSERAHSARLNAMRAAKKSPQEINRLVELAVGRFQSGEMVLFFAADFYLFNRNFVQAAYLLETLTARRPDNPIYHGVLAEVYLRQVRDAEALTSARTALRLDPQNPYAHFAMGLIFFELGQHLEAIEAFTKVTLDDERRFEAQWLLALSEARLGRNVRTIDVLRPLVEQRPERVDLQYELGKSLQAVRRFDEALVAFAAADKLKPNDSDILMMLGGVHSSTANFDKALEYFEKIARLNPGNPNYQMFVNVNRGRRSAIQKIPELMRLADDAPKSPMTLMDLVYALGYANRIDEAEKYIQAVYRLDPSDSRFYRDIGLVYDEAGMNEKALDAYERSLAKAVDPSAYLGMAGIYRQLGQIDQAAAAYSKVIAIKPDTPNIIKGFADMLRDHGKRQEALEMYKRSLALVPANPPVLLHAGILSLKLGDRDTALNYLSTLESIDPASARILRRCIESGIWG